MTVRSRKMISIIVAAAMVFGMNTVTFAGETGNTSSQDATAAVMTTETNSPSANVMNWYLKENASIMRPLFNYWVEAGGSEKKTIMSEHIVNGKSIAISDNQGDYKYDAHMANEGMGVSSNVFKLDDTTYLVVTYDAGWIWTNNNGTNVPLTTFNGKRHVPTYKDPNNGKVEKETYDLWANASLVKQEPGKAPEVIANTMSQNSKGKRMISIDIRPKNNLYANVSMNATKDGNVAIDNPYLKNGAYPYFNISVKLDKELKQYKKLLNKAVGQDGKELRKSEFRFDITRNYFAKAFFNTISEGSFVGENHDGSKHYSGWTEKYGFRHAFPDPDLQYDEEGDVISTGGGYNSSWIGERTITLDQGENKESLNIGSLDLYTDAKKVGKNNINVYIINGKDDYTGSITASGWNKKGSYSTYRLKAKKDYEVDTSLGEGILLLKPIGNFEGDGAIFRNAEYTVPKGYYDNFSGSRTAKEQKMTEVRVGVYNMDTANYYIDSVE